MDRHTSSTRIASVKETGEEISQADWERFDEAVASLRAERRRRGDDETPCGGASFPGGDVART